MARANYDSTMAVAVASGAWSPAILAALQFRSETVYAWSGAGTLTWNGMTFTGTGMLGRVSLAGGDMGSVAAGGGHVALSGIDPVAVGEALNDLLPNGAATLWLAAFANGAPVGTPYQIFSGLLGGAQVTADAPTPASPDSANASMIALALETTLKQLNRPSKRRYTAADQNRYYPDDSAFNWVAIEEDLALRWGA